MAKRAVYKVTVAGADITSKLSPVLMSITVQLNADGQADTTEISLDDTGARIRLPTEGAPITVAMGWADTGLRTVFTGTVDEVRSRGSRSGREVSISAKGMEAAGKPKASLRRHWDDATVKTILTDAGREAGITKVSVDPALAGLTLKYWAMIDESFLAMGRRLAQEIGGHFRVQGVEALMARRGATYLTAVRAIYGVNLHAWDIIPMKSRAIYGTMRATWYDRAQAAWKQVDVPTGLRSDAVLTLRPPAATEAEATRQAKAAAETSKRDSGGGSITIEGDPAAIPDALCALVGARSGVNGSYRIAGVSHSITRGAGFVTSLEVSQAQG